MPCTFLYLSRLSAAADARIEWLTSMYATKHVIDIDIILSMHVCCTVANSDSLSVELIIT
jgi:hypothetical protein